MRKPQILSRENWFNASKAASFSLLLFSFIPNINFSFLFGAYDNVRATKELDILFFITQGIIGLAFGITFFAPLWAKLPISTENDFLSYRYSGKYVEPLKKARAILLGLFIIPLLMALILEHPLSLLEEEGVNKSNLLLTLIGILLIYGFKNSLQHRIKFDFFIGIAVVAACIICIPLLLESLKTQDISLNLNLKNDCSSDILMTSIFTWWFSNIVDLPDMRAQKLLSAKSQKSGYYSILLATGIMMFIQGIMLCVYALLREHSNTLLQWICMGIILSSSIVQLMNLQHWSGNLMQPIFSKITKINKIRNYFPMAISLFIAYGLCVLTDNLFQLVQGILFFSAGVGPVYLLRWISSRMNAITQLTAIVSSLALGTIYILMLVSGFISTKSDHWLGLSQSNLAVLGLGTTNCLIWIFVMFYTQNRIERTKAKMILNEIHDNKRNAWPRQILQFLITAILFVALFLGPYILLIGI